MSDGYLNRGDDILDTQYVEINGKNYLNLKIGLFKTEGIQCVDDGTTTLIKTTTTHTTTTTTTITINEQLLLPLLPLLPLLIHLLLPLLR